MRGDGDSAGPNLGGNGADTRRWKLVPNPNVSRWWLA